MTSPTDPIQQTTPRTDEEIIAALAVAAGVEPERAGVILDRLNGVGLYIVPGDTLTAEQMMEPIRG